MWKMRIRGYILVEQDMLTVFAVVTKLEWKEQDGRNHYNSFQTQTRTRNVKEDNDWEDRGRSRFVVDQDKTALEKM